MRLQYGCYKRHTWCYLVKKWLAETFLCAGKIWLNLIGNETNLRSMGGYNALGLRYLRPLRALVCSPDRALRVLSRTPQIAGSRDIRRISFVRLIPRALKGLLRAQKAGKSAGKSDFLRRPIVKDRHSRLFWREFFWKFLVKYFLVDNILHPSS